MSHSKLGCAICIYCTITNRVSIVNKEVSTKHSDDNLSIRILLYQSLKGCTLYKKLPSKAV